MIHPLDKIFGGIPAGSSDFTHASVRYYIYSLNQRKAIGYCKTGLGRIQVAILDGDESFFL